MTFPDDFFEEERRGGFLVSEVMKRSWAADLQILEELGALCKRHGIRFFACYGTLLGAVRERGFIPWDDDVDIGMTGNDYVRFLEVVEAELGDRYTALNPYTRPWYHMNFTHIINGSSVDFHRAHLREWQGCPFMSGPDVYPYYYLPRNPDEARYVCDVLSRIDEAIAMNRQVERDIAHQPRLAEALAQRLVELQHETGYEFTQDRPMENQLEILYDQVCRITAPDEADEVVRYDEYMKDSRKRFPKVWLEHTVELPFENVRMPVPAGYDAILRARFGDSYIVPRQEGALHEYPYYARQLQGVTIPDALKPAGIAMGAVAEAGGAVDDGNVAVGDAGDAADMVGGAGAADVDMAGPGPRVLYHGTLETMLSYNEHVLRKIDAVLEAFGQGGTKRGGAGDVRPAARLTWLPVDFPETDEYALDLVAPRLIAGYRERVARAWRGQTEWPESLQEGDGSRGESSAAVDGERGASSALVRDGEDMVRGMDGGQAEGRGLSHGRGIDAIVRAHDIYYGDACDISDGFAAAGKTVILQDYRAEGVDRQLLEALEARGYVVAVAGIQGAEEAHGCAAAVVDSQGAEDAHEGAAAVSVAQGAGDAHEGTTAISDSQDAAGIELGREAAPQLMAEIPAAWRRFLYREDGSRRKAILYQNTFSGLYQYQGEMLDKLRDVLAVFRDASADVALLWRPQPEIADSHELFDEQLWREYQQILRTYREEGWGILDLGESAEPALQVADAYYGGADALALRIRQRGLPVMIEDVSIRSRA